ncbi:MAG: MarC family protein [Hyphomicrobiaceae bacterium]|jgi:multiple antibiotic resistance protein
MLETALTAFTTFFATIGPIEAAAVFASLTSGIASERRRAIALKAVAIATLMLLFFTLAGQPLLRQLGVSLAALQTAGGIVLLLISLDMIFARPGQSRLTPPEDAEAHIKDDIAVFPLATPLLAGPGTMSAAMVMAANAAGEPMRLGLVTLALLAVMAVTLVLLLVANRLDRLIGITASRVLMRVFGILLAAIAVQSAFNGLAASGLMGDAGRP